VSKPKQYLPGETLMLTRRCTQRQLLLTPSREVLHLCLYALGYAQQKHGIELHCFVFLSNHEHLQLTDRLGNRAEFARDLDRLIAKSVNAHLGRFENLWDSGRPSYVRLLDADAVRENTQYILTNPVKDGLVPRAKDWPGLWSDPRHFDGAPIKVKRPAFFYDPTGEMPDEVEIRLTAPPCFAEMNRRDYLEQTYRDIKEFERNVQAERAAKGFLGRRAILAQDPFGYPKGFEPRFQLNPTLKCRDKWRRIEQIQADANWLAEYQGCRERSCRGDTDVVFPAGTYYVVRFFGARCKDPPACAAA
jgi:putative transposase